MVDKEASRGGRVLAELSNAMVALHRENFGRGPGAARSVLAEDLVVCVLEDVYTPVERTLIDAGQGAHVKRSRALHQAVAEAEYKEAVEAITERSVAAFLSVAHIDPDLLVETFILGPGDARGD